MNHRSGHHCGSRAAVTAAGWLRPACVVALLCCLASAPANAAGQAPPSAAWEGLAQIGVALPAGDFEAAGCNDHGHIPVSVGVRRVGTLAISMAADWFLRAGPDACRPQAEAVERDGVAFAQRESGGLELAVAIPRARLSVGVPLNLAAYRLVPSLEVGAMPDVRGNTVRPFVGGGLGAEVGRHLHFHALWGVTRVGFERVLSAQLITMPAIQEQADEWSSMLEMRAGLRWPGQD